jgi:undecaprenyl-diphosphatase
VGCLSLFSAVLLGIIQGLTEFLPVSSSGHLVLFSSLLNLQQSSIVFEVLVHVGTLGAVLVVFWGEFVEMVQGFLKLIRSPSRWRELYDSDAGCRLFIWLVVGTLPAVAAALLLNDQVERAFSNTRLVGGTLILTGLILFLADRASRRTQGRSQTIADSLWVGIGQAAALLPGISRSGTTIACGLARGLSREQAARFSFLLSIPSIFGALVYSLPDLAKGRTPASTGVLLAGMLAAALTGYLAIRMLLAVIRGGRLVWFSYYTWFVGLLVLIFA